MNRKIIFYVLSAVLLLLAARYFAVEGFLSQFAALEEQIAAKQKTLEEVQRLESDYRRGADEISGLARILETRRKDYTPLTFLEGLFSDSNTEYEIVYREPQAISGEEGLMESSVRVEFNEIDINSLVTYLYKIENSSEFLRLRNLSVRPRENLLRASFEVATIVPGS
jgi:hypothetical protein